MVEFLYALIGSNFLHRENVFILVLLIVLLVNQKFKIRLDKMWFLLAISGITYMIIYQYNMGAMELSMLQSRVISPLLLYFVGLNRAYHLPGKIKTDWLIISFASFAHCFANTIKNRSLNILSVEGRMLNDIYGGEVTATLQNLGFIFVCGLLFYACFIENKKSVRYALILAIIGSALGSVLTASRTVLYLIVLCFCFSLLLFVKLNKNKRKNTNVFIAVAITVIIITMAIWVNLFGITDKIMATALGVRLNANGTSGVIDNLRWEYAHAVFDMLPSYPLGNIPYSHYAHNFWLDIAKEVGIIPFIGYVAFYLISIIRFIMAIKNKMLDDKLKQFMMPYFLAFSVALFTEPIMQGIPVIFSLFALFVGYVSGYSAYPKVKGYARENLLYDKY